jgi:hypothetical protein
MISDEHLQDLLDLRRNLLREVARLDLVISREYEHRRTPPIHHRPSLTWQDALHEAKVQPPPMERQELVMEP